MELAILESLYNPDMISGNYAKELVKKILRKNFKNLNLNTIADIIKLGKHHSSINRLNKLSKSIDTKISDEITKIIKKYSYFVDVG